VYHKCLSVTTIAFRKNTVDVQLRTVAAKSISKKLIISHNRCTFAQISAYTYVIRAHFVKQIAQQRLRKHVAESTGKKNADFIGYGRHTS